MTAEDDDSTIGGEPLKRLEDLERRRAVEAARRLVEEEDRGERDELTADREPPPLAAADAAPQCAADEDVGDVAQTQLGHGLLDDGGALLRRDGLGQAQRGGRLERLGDREVRQEGVVLPHVADGLLGGAKAGRARPCCAGRRRVGDLARRELEVADSTGEHVQKGGCIEARVSCLRRGRG